MECASFSGNTTFLPPSAFASQSDRNASDRKSKPNMADDKSMEAMFKQFMAMKVGGGGGGGGNVRLVKFKDYTLVPYPTQIRHHYKKTYVATADWASMEHIQWGKQVFKTPMAFVKAHNERLNEQGIRKTATATENIWLNNTTEFLQNGEWVSIKSIVTMGKAPSMRETPAPGMEDEEEEEEEEKPAPPAKPTKPKTQKPFKGVMVALPPLNEEELDEPDKVCSLCDVSIKDSKNKNFADCSKCSKVFCGKHHKNKGDGSGAVCGECDKK